MTDEEVMSAMRSDGALNRARREFSFGCARIEQAMQQRTQPTPIEMRRMEFETIRRILAALSDPDDAS